MPGNAVHRFRKIIVLGVNAVLLLGGLALHQAEGPVELAQLGPQGRVVAHLLGQDIPRARQGGLGVRHFLGYVLFGLRPHVQPGVLGQQRLGQGLQPPGFGHAGPGLALWLIGAVKVLHLGQGFGRRQRPFQLFGHGALLGDDRRHLALALFQPPQVVQPLGQGAQHLVVHGVGRFLAVAGDKGDGVALVDQRDGRRRILFGHV